MRRLKRGTLLSEIDQGQSLKLHKAGISVSNIARAIGRSYNCVRNYLASKIPYKHGGGSSPKLKERGHSRGMGWP